MQTIRCRRRAFLATIALATANLSLLYPAFAGEPKLPAGEFTFAQLCDTQFGMGGYEDDLARFSRAVELVNESGADFVVICGDLVNKANKNSFADFNRVKAGFKVPCYPAPGNHDVGGPPTAKTLKFYRDTVGKDYLSFTHKGYTFVVVNTQLWQAPVENESDKHDEWFNATLRTAAEKRFPVFVVGHIPVYVKDIDEKDAYYNLPLAMRAGLLERMHAHGVVALLAGHTHKTIIKEHQGIQIVNGETTSKNFDGRPFGFRLWHVGPSRPFRHEFVPLEKDQSDKEG